MSKFVKIKKDKLINSFKYAFEGISSSFKQEQNLKIHSFIMALVIICGFIFKINITEWLICILLFGIVISLELVNTAMEALCDLVMPDINPKVKIVKDVMAGAVLVGLIIFLPKIINLIK